MSSSTSAVTQAQAATRHTDWVALARPRSDRAEGRVTISCQISGIDFVWQLAEGGRGTRIDVRVALPDSEAHRLDDKRENITTSLARLATLAHAAATS